MPSVAFEAGLMSSFSEEKTGLPNARLTLEDGFSSGSLSMPAWSIILCAASGTESEVNGRLSMLAEDPMLLIPQGQL